jgi:hypothetical protein
MKIKLRREWQGQDSWGAFVEEIAIDPKTLKLAYRISTGGNCNYGVYESWQDEKAALEFILGPVQVNGNLRSSLFVALSKLPDLNEINLPKDFTDRTTADINYGNY